MSLSDVISQYPSSIITISIALAFLWLALYVFRVNPEDSISKLAAGAMVIVFLYLLSDFLSSTALSRSYVALYQRLLWWLPFAPVLWLHLSQLVTDPLEFKGAAWRHLGDAINALRSSAALGALYGCAALFWLAGAFTDSLYRYSALRAMELPLLSQSLPTGPVYTLFTVFIFLTTSLAWINFLAQWHKESAARSQFWWLGLGSILFWVASTGLLIKTVTDIRSPIAFGNKFLGFGMIIVAIAILKYNALVKKESLEKDVIYASIGALGIATIYIGILFLGQGTVLGTPVASTILVACLALTTHMLADTLKIWFSEFIGTRIGLISASDVTKMKQLYQEASRVKRQQALLVELFDDGNKTVEGLLALLTPRQREIITLRAKGLSDKQIADALDIKLPTVRKHIEDIKSRIGSRDKADCAVYCVVTGLLSKDDLMDWFDSLTTNGENI